MIIDFPENQIRISGLITGEELHENDIQEVKQELNRANRLILIGLRINQEVAQWISLALNQKKEVVVYQRLTKRLRTSHDFQEERELTAMFVKQGVQLHTSEETLAKQLGTDEFQAKDFILMYPDPESVLTVLYGLGAKQIVNLNDIEEVKGLRRSKKTSPFTRMVTNGLDFYVTEPAQSMLGFVDKFGKFFEDIVEYAQADASAATKEEIFSRYKTARSYGYTFLRNIEQYCISKDTLIGEYDFSQLDNVIPLNILTSWKLNVPIRLFIFKRKIVIEYENFGKIDPSLQLPDLRTIHPEITSGGKRGLLPYRVEIEPERKREFIERLHKHLMVTV